MSTIKPAPTQLFCKETSADVQTKSGLFIPQQSAEKPQTAEVINIGADVKHYQQKDEIIYRPYATTPVKLDGKEYFLVDQEDVLGTVI